MHSNESEQAVLGSLLIDNEIMDDVNLSANDFYHKDHQVIFKTIQEMIDDNEIADVLTVSEKLGKDVNLIGGMSYLGSLHKNVSTTANAKAYAKIVKDNFQLRNLFKAGSTLIEMANNGSDVSEIIDKAQSIVLGFDDVNKNDAFSVSEILPVCIDKLDERCKSGLTISGLSTGFEVLDRKISGLHDGDLIIIGGRPSMGKTTLGTNIARFVCLQGEPVLLFSLEMPKEQIIDREITAVSGIQFNHLRNGQLTEQEWPEYAQATSELDKKPLYIDDTPGLSVNELRRRARRTKKKHGLSLIVVDYIQLMADEGENLTHSVELISKGLKNLAKELNIPVIALSQLNRGVEQRPNKRPVMSDLRQSGAIEQDADLILFVYRDEVYNDESQDKGIAEILIGKQRNGEIGTVRLSFEGWCCRFKDLSHSDHMEQRR